MPRIRSIKPDFWSDGRVKRLTDSQALLFIALWNFVDDEGKIRADYDEIAAKTTRFTPQHISRNLAALWEVGLIEVYTSEPHDRVTEVSRQSHKHPLTGTRPSHDWFTIVSWHHQKISRPHIPHVKLSDLIKKPRRVSVNNIEQSLQGKDRIGKDRIGKDIYTRKVVKEVPSMNDGDNLSPKYLVDLWNERRQGLPECMELSAARIKKANSQIRKYNNTDHWVDTLAAFTSSDFCLNQWRPCFDDFLNEAKRIRALEGTYDNNKGPKSFADVHMDKLKHINRKARQGEFFE